MKVKPYLNLRIRLTKCRFSCFKLEAESGCSENLGSVVVLGTEEVVAEVGVG